MSFSSVHRINGGMNFSLWFTCEHAVNTEWRPGRHTHTHTVNGRTMNAIVIPYYCDYYLLSSLSLLPIRLPVWLRGVAWHANSQTLSQAGACTHKHTHSSRPNPFFYWNPLPNRFLYLELEPHNSMRGSGGRGGFAPRVCVQHRRDSSDPVSVNWSSCSHSHNIKIIFLFSHTKIAMDLYWNRFSFARAFLPLRQCNE